MIVAAPAAGGAPVSDTQEDGFFANTKRRGKAVVEYRDAEIHVVAAYYYSQQNHDSRWLLIEAAMSTTRNLTIDRESITLATPAGRTITLAAQERFAADVNRVTTLLQNAAVSRHNLLAYFSQRSGREAMRLFAVHGGTVLTNFVTDVHHVAVGDLFFESPTGRWDRGTHSLVIERAGARAVLPIELE
jgi:hypothetical protein